MACSQDRGGKRLRQDADGELLITRALTADLLAHCMSYQDLTRALGPSAACKALSRACSNASTRCTALMLANEDDDTMGESGEYRANERMGAWADRMGEGDGLRVRSLTFGWRTMRICSEDLCACPQLASFTLKDLCSAAGACHPSMYELTQTLAKIARLWPSLRALALQCRLLTNAHLTQIAQHFPRLHELRITGAHQITGTGLGHVTKIASLRVLSLVDCVHAAVEAEDPRFVRIEYRYEPGAGCHLRCGCARCYSCEMNANFCRCDDEEEWCEDEIEDDEEAARLRQKTRGALLDVEQDAGGLTDNDDGFWECDY